MANHRCIWLRALLVNLSEDPLLHTRVKHVDIKYHFLCEHIQSKEIDIKYINTNDNIADVFTKALNHKKFTCFHSLLGLVWDMIPCEEEYVHGEEEC